VARPVLGARACLRIRPRLSELPPILVSMTRRPPTTAETPSASGRSSAATIPRGSSASRRRS